MISTVEELQDELERTGLPRHWAQRLNDRVLPRIEGVYVIDTSTDGRTVVSIYGRGDLRHARSFRDEATAIQWLAPQLMRPRVIEDRSDAEREQARERMQLKAEATRRALEEGTSGSGATTREDRARGVLLGMACGDALGVPYEFETLPLGPDEEPQMVGGGLGPYAPGEWSDDTQMAIVIAQVAAAHDLRDETALDEIAQGWIDWMSGGASDIGNQTRRVLSTAARGDVRRGAADRVRTAAAELHAATGHTAGNGSLMRTAPVALAFLDDPAGLAAAARAISDLTHPDPVAGDACVLWCEAIRRAVTTGDDVDLLTLVDDLPDERREQWRAWIRDAEARTPSEFNPNGYAPVALQAAWSAVRHPWTTGTHAGNPLAGSLVAAVHAGNDTDTVAAIAGGFLGARWGANAVPPAWRGVSGWPGLAADNLLALADRITGARTAGDWVADLRIQDR